MRLGRRLSTGVAEHPPAPVPEPQQDEAEVAPPHPAESAGSAQPVELAER